MKNAPKFFVATVSDQINGNILAWANNVSTFDTYEAAKADAIRRYDEDWDSIPQGQGYSLGYTYIVHDGVDVL